MNRLISYVLVFVLGFALCAFTLYELYGVPVGKSPSSLSPITRAQGRPTPRLGLDPIPAAVERVKKSVVNIDTVGRPTYTGVPIPDFFGFGFGTPQPAIPRGQASGVIISRDGYILTNNHVVADARVINVTLFDGKRFSAKVVGTDPKTDLAVIKINARDLTPATFGDSSQLKVGDWVIAIGNALGLGATVTVGVISATERGPLEIEPGKVLENVIQTDAAINRGNSGGALADINGNIIGINTAIASTSPGGGSIGIGFAIPSNTASKIAEELIKKGKVVRPPKPWIGIGYEPISEDIRAGLSQMGLNIPKNAQVIIVQIYPDSPAAKAGILRYDIILEINGKKITSPEMVRNEVLKLKAGQTVNLLIWRQGKEILIPVKIGAAPEELLQQR